jgi:tetratricopeptide (TPR) repeat protein
MNINISRSNLVRGVNIAGGGTMLLDDDDAVFRLGGEYNFGREQIDYRDLYLRAGLVFRKNADTRLCCGAGIERGELSIDYGVILGDKDNPTYNIGTLGYKFGFIKIEPDDVEKQYKLGEKYYFQGNLLMAQHRFERVLRMSRNYKGTIGYLEKIVKLMGQIKSERPIVESDLEKIRNLMGKADRFLKDEKYQDAMKFYVAILVIDKNNL